MSYQESCRWSSGGILGALLVSAVSIGCSGAAVPADDPGGTAAAPGEVDQAPAAGGGT